MHTLPAADLNGPCVYYPYNRLSCGVLITAIALTVCFNTPAHARSSRLWSENTSTTAPLAQVPNFRILAQQVVPSVVSIHVVISRDNSVGDWWGGRPRDYRSTGIGSGFVIRKDGLILTNNHVVEGAQSIEVSFAHQEHRVQAEVVGTAPAYDIALLRTTSKTNTKVAFLGDSDRLHIGDWVMAVGNPFGLSHSVSVGIVSAKERRNVDPEGRKGLYDFIQTDASINPGNSGGPLVNMRGEVIGINTAVQSGNSIGFAIPINMIKALLPELQSKGSYTRSYIGLRVRAVTERIANERGLDFPHGAFVREVIDAGPAARGGLVQGDVIVEFDKKPIRDSRDLALLVSMAGVGQKVAIKVWRAGRYVDRSIRLTAVPNTTATIKRKGLGLTVANISPALRKKYRLRTSRGVVVTKVYPNSLAQRVGFELGDQLEALNDSPIVSAEQFSKAVGNISKGSALRVRVRRGGSRIYLAMTKP